VRQLDESVPVLAWNYVDGLHGQNDKGVEVLAALGGEGVVAATRREPIEALNIFAVRCIAPS
jgi:hypothetical protein